MGSVSEGGQADGEVLLIMRYLSLYSNLAAYMYSWIALFVVIPSRSNTAVNTVFA